VGEDEEEEAGCTKRDTVSLEGGTDSIEDNRVKKRQKTGAL
jgi:hypothetical protein